MAGSDGDGLRVEGLTVEYVSGGHAMRPLEDFELHAPGGTFVLLAGPSGSGKTTLLSCLASILSPTAGSISFGDLEVTALDPKERTAYRRSTVGIVFQAFNLVPSLTAVENVMAPLLAAGVRRSEAAERAEALLERVGLADRSRHRPGQLSGGQQQRVAIARALVHDPPLVLADEPTAHLDHVQVDGVLELLAGLVTPGRVLVAATHDDRLLAVGGQRVDLGPPPPSLTTVGEMPDDTRPEDTLRDLAEEYWDTFLEANPTTATLLGDHRFDDRIEDFSVEGDAALRARWTSLLDRVAAVDAGGPAGPGGAAAEEAMTGLAGEDAVTHGQLTAELQDAIALLDARLVELASDQMTSFHVGLLQSLPMLSAPDAATAEMAVERFRRVPAAIEQATGRFLAGAAAGRTPAAVCVSRSLNVIEGYLASALEDDVLLGLAGPAGWEGEAAWRATLRRVAEDDVRPAYRRLAETLRSDLLPSARDDDHCGLCWLADGPELYATLVAHHTSLDLPAEEIHRAGLEEVTGRLPAEYAEVGGRVFGTTDQGAVLGRLRTDPALRYRTGDEILDDARRALVDASAAMAGWFGRLPQSACVIETVPEFLAPDSPAAYYFPPASDGSRGGTYYVNTDRPGNKARYETASIAFHEAIPGHHLQLAIATELSDLPRFRRLSISNTAYVEGWGLYAERLADEMGLYRSDLERLGMLAGDSIRACRLVVDTGLHALGWSRVQAIDFMAANCPVSVEEVAVEVDRYIGMPGQALAYKLGQREIFRLREGARSRLGGAFDIRGFHDAVLGSGAVSLPVLGGLVDRWIATATTAT